MGDRAYAQVLCHAKDVAAFEELGFGEQEYWKRLPEGVSFLVDQEANYGNSSSLREMAERGYVFIAQHDAGGDYDAGRLVSDGKTFREVDAMVHEPRPCVAVDANGKKGWIKKQCAPKRTLLVPTRIGHLSSLLQNDGTARRPIGKCAAAVAVALALGIAFDVAAMP
jgi:hypothetical protein